MNAEPVICAALLHDAAGDYAGDLAPGGWHLMGAGYYEDLAGRLYGLVIRLSDRLPTGQAGWLHHVTKVGEYGLALEDMTGMLACGKIAVTDHERGDMLALARQMGMDDLVWQALRSCARAGEVRDPGA